MSDLVITDKLIEKALREFYKGVWIPEILYFHFSYGLDTHFKNLTPMTMWYKTYGRSMDTMATHMLFVIESYRNSKERKEERMKNDSFQILGA